MHEIASGFGHEGFVKTKLFDSYCKKSLWKAIHFSNFEISPLLYKQKVLPPELS